DARVPPRAQVVFQFEARAEGQLARAERVREEFVREAAVAWSDIQALEAQLDAQQRSYIATRQARDVLLERFISARGTLFDVLEAEEEYFQSAVLLIQTITELDAAHYVLLSRTGRLLDALAVDPTPTMGDE
ncbi:MAG: TolC family protein, partial [Sphingomonadaceae bacterium]|nr:TolC family protein [Sphingomonadaceae bacterium]